MFPTDSYTVQIAQLTKIPVATTILNNFEFDYVKGQFNIVDGKPAMNSGVQAIEQWIILFFNTALNAYPVYANTKFGTNINSLLGKKLVNNGFVESEVQRQITEGFALCPDIQKITSYNMVKNGRTLQINMTILTYSGQTISSNISINTAVSGGVSSTTSTGSTSSTNSSSSTSSTTSTTNNTNFEIAISIALGG